AFSGGAAGGGPERDLVDVLRRLGPDVGATENLARRFVGAPLDEAFRLAERARLATGREREPPDRDLAPFLAGARLRRTDRGDLRTAVGARRHVRVVDRARALAGDRLGRHDALGHRLVGEQRRARHVADGVDPLHRGFHLRRDLPDPTVELDAGALQPEPGDLRRPAHGHEAPLDFELLAAEIDDDARTPGLHRRYLDAGLHGDPAPGERPRQLLR